MIVIKVLISIVLCCQIIKRMSKDETENELHKRIGANMGKFLNVLAYIGAVYFIFN